MVVGFKGAKNKLKELYSSLGLEEKPIESLSEFKSKLKAGSLEQNGVITNYNDLMASETATADQIEQQDDIMKMLSKYKKNLYLGMTTRDGALDQIKLDVAVATKLDIKNIDESIDVIKDLYEFTNTDLAYNGKLADDMFVVKKSSDLRGQAVSLSELKNIIR